MSIYENTIFSLIFFLTGRFNERITFFCMNKGLLAEHAVVYECVYIHEYIYVNICVYSFIYTCVYVYETNMLGNRKTKGI